VTIKPRKGDAHRRQPSPAGGDRKSVRRCQPCCAYGNEDGKRRFPEIPCDWPPRPSARQKENQMETTDRRLGRMPDELMSGEKDRLARGSALNGDDQSWPKP
jgi:hypothetical protein